MYGGREPTAGKGDDDDDDHDYHHLDDDNLWIYSTTEYSKTKWG
jgi:hypothetical protein